MAVVLASVAAYETKVRWERQLAGIARTVGLDRKTVYRALARTGAGPGASGGRP